MQHNSNCQFFDLLFRDKIKIKLSLAIGKIVDVVIFEINGQISVHGDIRQYAKDHAIGERPRKG